MVLRSLAAALVLLQCLVAVSALRFEITPEEQELHPNELSIIDPGALAVHPDMGQIQGSVTMSLNLTANQKIENGDFIAVTVSKKPIDTDWVALYCPGDIDQIEKVSPVNYAKLSYTGSSATVNFQMVNMRTNCSFYLFTDPWDDLQNDHDYRHNKTIPDDVTDLVIAKSQTVYFKDENEPSKVRVLPTESEVPGSYAFRVMWSSLYGIEKNPKLQWWIPSCKVPAISTIDAISSTYTADDLCDEPATTWGYRSIGMINEAVIPTINPYQFDEITYRVGDDYSGWSKNFTLQVPPPIGSSEIETSLALFGDMGRGTVDDSFTWREFTAPSIETCLRLEEDVDNKRIDAVFHFGDISYAYGYSSVWDTYLHQVEGFVSRVPYLINLGNHEYDSPFDTWKPDYTPSIYDKSDSGGECGIPAMRLFKTPRADITRSWWSYNVGNIHIISINTEVDFSEGSEQLKFVSEDLATVDRCQFPWIILGGHRPMYIDSTYGGNPSSDIDVMDQLQLFVEPLMVKYNVTIGIYGHNHAYQRHCASYKSQCMQHSNEDTVFEYPEYPVQLVVGTAGASLTKNMNVQDPPAFRELVLYEFGYGRLTAHNASHLSFEFVSSLNGTVLDKMMIVQDPAAIGCPAYPNVSTNDGGSKLTDFCESDEDSKGKKSTNAAKIAVAVIVLAACVGAASAAVFVRLRQAKKERYCRLSNKEAYGNLELGESMELVTTEVVPTFSKNEAVGSQAGLTTIDEKDGEKEEKP